MTSSRYVIKTLEKKLETSKRQCDDKLEELDKLYGENDFLKGELGKIREKYDFTVIDGYKGALDRHEAWAVKVMATTVKVVNTFETYHTCGLCNSLAQEIIVLEPCNHVFCSKCIENQGSHSRCKVCGDPKQKEWKSTFVAEWMGAFESVNNEIDKIQRGYSDLSRV